VSSPAIKAGLGNDGLLVVNSAQDEKNIRQACGFAGKIAHVDANSIAEQELGVPITNTTMIGALLKACPDLVKLDSLRHPLEERFGANAGKNLQALERAFKETII
jgi:pyruvate ferredoxin oxidoreductase gamma subunit